MKWTVRTFSKTVDDEIAALPDDIRAKLRALVGAVVEAGPQALAAKNAKHLEGKLWELRLIGRDGIARVIYVTITGRQVVLLRAFVKKSQKTPVQDLEIARERANSLG